MPPILISLFVVAHGLVHASYLPPEPPTKPGAPAWPFHLERSWLLTPAGLDAAATRRIGVALVAVTVVGYALAALAILGVVPVSWFAPAAVAASATSAVLLALFFTPWIVLGLVIDTALAAAVLVAGWNPVVAG